MLKPAERVDRCCIFSKQPDAYSLVLVDDHQGCLVQPCEAAHTGAHQEAANHLKIVSYTLDRLFSIGVVLYLGHRCPITLIRNMKESVEVIASRDNLLAGEEDVRFRRERLAFNGRLKPTAEERACGPDFLEGLREGERVRNNHARKLLAELVKPSGGGLSARHRLG